MLIVGHTAFIVSRTYGTGGDWAFIELRTSDVFSTHPPLTGAWSRYGWNHPGPLMYLLLAVPYRLAGSWRGLWFGAMLLNVAAIVGVAVRAPHRRALSMVFPLAALWAIAAGTSHLFADPWNASLVVVPVITMVAATPRCCSTIAAAWQLRRWSSWQRRRPMLVRAAALTDDGDGARRRRASVAAVHAIWVAVGAVLCLPVFIDTVVHWPGNLYESLRFTMTSSEPASRAGARPYG